MKFDYLILTRHLPNERCEHSEYNKYIMLTSVFHLLIVDRSTKCIQMIENKYVPELQLPDFGCSFLRQVTVFHDYMYTQFCLFVAVLCPSTN